MSAAHISLTARLARDPESRTTGSGTTVCNLTLPVDTGWGDKKQTTWWTATLFGKKAEVAMRYLQKGSWVAVSGNAQVRTYEKRDGTTGFSAEVTVNDMSFVGPKPEDQPRAPGQPSASDVGRFNQGRQQRSYNDADVPF